jgi:hypothetical protein
MGGAGPAGNGMGMNSKFKGYSEEVIEACDDVEPILENLTWCSIQSLFCLVKGVDFFEYSVIE